MNNLRTIQGRWWIHGDDKSPCFGILSLDPEEKLVLEAKSLQNRTVEETWNALIVNQPVFEVIHGCDEHNRDVTLFGCFCPKFQASSGLDLYHISCLAGLTNHKGVSFDEPRFRAVSVGYTFLDEWMNQHVIEESKAELDEMSVKFKRGKTLDFNPCDGVRLRIGSDTTAKLPLGGFHYDTTYRIWFLFNELKSAQEIRRKYVPLFLRFLCLLTNERIFAEDINFFESDPFASEKPERHEACELLCTNNGITKAKQKTHASRMYATFREVESELDSILKRWFECYERMRPVMDLHFAVFSDFVTGYTTEFLLLAQALEVYHSRSNLFSSTEATEEKHEQRIDAIVQSAPTKKDRDWLKYKLKFSNQKTLGQRLADILNQHGNEVQRLTAGINDFADKVRDSRNYYTHYSQKLLQTGSVANDAELIRIGFILEALLKICLLKEIGIQGKPIETIIAQYASSKFTNLVPNPVPKTNQ